ncbi:MAG: shikimate kinase [Tannerella sp.]|nr:shikimate kinase [Tannerella sp.]
MQRIFLVGYMCAGKTTLGKVLSEQTNLSFIDLDQFIEECYLRTIPQLFEERGENGFREIERKVLCEVAGFDDVVISTGGGTPCFHGNMALMNSAGTTVYLKLPVGELVKRIEPHKGTRPLLKNRSGDGLKQFVEKSLAERTPYYEQAQIVLNAEMMDSQTDVNTLAGRLGEILFS